MAQRGIQSLSPPPISHIASAKGRGLSGDESEGAEPGQDEAAAAAASDWLRMGVCVKAHPDSAPLQPMETQRWLFSLIPWLEDAQCLCVVDVRSAQLHRFFALRESLQHPCCKTLQMYGAETADFSGLPTVTAVVKTLDNIIFKIFALVDEDSVKAHNFMGLDQFSIVLFVCVICVYQSL